jgi:hypothetical protein
MDRDQLLEALMKADAAGDTEAANLFAEDIRKIDAAKASPKAEYDKLPGWQKPLVAAADTARLAGSGASFGFAEKALAGIKSALTDATYDDQLKSERAATDAARNRAGSAALPAELLGSLATGSAAQKVGATTMNAVAPPTAGFLQRMLGQLSGGAVEGGAYGMLDALGHDTDVKEGVQSGAAFGAGSGALGEVVSSLANKIGNRGIGPAKAPTLDELQERARRGYKAVEEADVNIASDAVTRLNQDLGDFATSPQGPRKARHPATFAEIDRLGEYSPSLKDPKVRSTEVSKIGNSSRNSTTVRNGGNPVNSSVDANTASRNVGTTVTRDISPDRGMTLYDVDQHRQTVNRNVGRNRDDAERYMGDELIGRIDKFVDNLAPPDILSGDLPKGRDALLDAREASHRVKKLKEVGSGVRAAERSADAASSVHQGTQTRQKIAAMLNDERKVRGYKPEELKQMEEIVEGTKGGNRWRKVANIAGNLPGYAAGGAVGSGIGSLIAGAPGAAAGGTLGIGAAKGAQMAAARMAEKSTDKQVQQLMDTIARGGVKPNLPQPKNMMSPAARGNFNRALIQLGLIDEEGNPL